MSNIDALAAGWLEAKAAEVAANKRRMDIEAQLTEALDVKDEGSKTHKLTNYKVTLKQPVYRKVDADEWERVRGAVPEMLRPVKTKVEADPAGMKWLAEHHPALWAKIASAFTTTKGKVGVEVTKIQTEAK